MTYFHRARGGIAPSPPWIRYWNERDHIVQPVSKSFSLETSKSIHKMDTFPLRSTNFPLKKLSTFSPFERAFILANSDIDNRYR